MKGVKQEIELYLLKSCLQHCAPIEDDNIRQKRKCNSYVRQYVLSKDEVLEYSSIIALIILTSEHKAEAHSACTFNTLGVFFLLDIE